MTTCKAVEALGITVEQLQEDMGSTGSEMYKSIMAGLMEDLHDIPTHGEPQGRKTVMEDNKKSCS